MLCGKPRRSCGASPHPHPRFPICEGELGKGPPQPPPRPSQCLQSVLLFIQKLTALRAHRGSVGARSPRGEPGVQEPRPGWVWRPGRWVPRPGRCVSADFPSCGAHDSERVSRYLLAKVAGTSPSHVQDLGPSSKGISYLDDSHAKYFGDLFTSTCMG